MTADQMKLPPKFVKGLGLKDFNSICFLTLILIPLTGPIFSLSPPPRGGDGVGRIPPLPLRGAITKKIPLLPGGRHPTTARIAFWGTTVFPQLSLMQ
jgi:hypothetical protein